MARKSDGPSLGKDELQLVMAKLCHADRCAAGGVSRLWHEAVQALPAFLDLGATPHSASLEAFIARTKRRLPTRAVVRGAPPPGLPWREALARCPSLRDFDFDPHLMRDWGDLLGLERQMQSLRLVMETGDAGALLRLRGIPLHGAQLPPHWRFPALTHLCLSPSVLEWELPRVAPSLQRLIVLGREARCAASDGCACCRPQLVFGLASHRACTELVLHDVRLTGCDLYCLGRLGHLRSLSLVFSLAHPDRVPELHTAQGLTRLALSQGRTSASRVLLLHGPLPCLQVLQVAGWRYVHGGALPALTHLCLSRATWHSIALLLTVAPRLQQLLVHEPLEPGTSGKVYLPLPLVTGLRRLVCAPASLASVLELPRGLPSLVVEFRDLSEEALGGLWQGWLP